jgi:starch phosphorylase
MTAVPTVGYFSMEIAINATMPLYSGGLGVLAGDTLRSAADLHVPLVAVTLLYRKGYFYQQLDAGGQQREEPVAWVPDDVLRELPVRASVSIEGRTVWLRPWRYDVAGIDGGQVPVYLLDADLPENTEADRRLTDSLYGGDQRYRLCQEIILGIGGVRMLRALGYRDVHIFHMNEGHASLLTVELLDEEAHRAGRGTITPADVEAVRRQCVFTTHTPVPAGHDQFPLALVNEVLRRPELFAMKEVFSCDGVLNLTYLALNLSYYVNGVATRHAEVSRAMFAPHVIDAITNGVHATTWASPPFAALFDAHIPGWRQNNARLRHALRIPTPDLMRARREAKRSLIEYVNRAANTGMDLDVLTLGFGRRATPYKRTDLLLTDVERLRYIAATVGPLQVVYAGKAHPRDEGGKELIRRIVRAAASLVPLIKIVYLENYDIELARALIAGSDIWLNTPQPPLEASGTSGMKAAINGVPSLSVLDGWWIEGHTEGVTGWSIGEPHEVSAPASDTSASDATSLYDKLERSIAPMFYREPDRFADVMRHAIALNGSFFNTQRMIQEYVSKAYLRQAPASDPAAG